MTNNILIYAQKFQDIYHYRDYLYYFTLSCAWEVIWYQGPISFE